MGKYVTAIASVGLAVAIAVAAPALAPGLLSLLGTTTATALATSLATAAIGVALSVAAGFAIQALQPRAKIEYQMSRAPVGNSKIIYGERRVSGQLVFFHPRTAGKKYYRYFVICVAGHRCDGVTSWLLNDQTVSVDGSGKVTSGPYANASFLWFARGTDDQAANSTFVAETGGKWTAAHRGRGLALIYARFEMTDDVIQAGMPNISAVIRGKDDIRDPRTGARGYLRNAVAVFYDWMSMPREEGGFGAYADEIPDDDWLSAQVNVADEAVPLRAGGTEQRYAFDSVIELGAAPSEIRSTFITCCAGTYTYSGGKHLMRPGYWVPVSVTLQENDLAGPISVPLLGDDSEIATEVSGTFVDPASLYQPQPVPTRSVQTDDVRQGDYDLPHITSHPRGQRILEIMLRRAQAEKRVTWPMNIVGLGVRTMDTVQLATSRYGLSNYAWTVKNWGISADYSVVLQVREENQEIYEWSTAMELLPGEVPEFDRADPISDTPPRAAYLIVRQSNAYPLDSTATTITTVAFDATIDDGRVLSFPAQTITGLDDGSTYVVLWDLTAQTFIAAPAPALAETASPNYVIIRQMTTQNADGTFPAEPTAPGGDGGGGYGGGGCPEISERILLANAGRTGPGETIAAGNIQAGDWVWAQLEDEAGSDRFGAYRVTMSRVFESDLCPIAGLPLTSPSHLWWDRGWIRSDALGTPAGTGKVVALSVAKARTYILVDAQGRWHLSHNKRATQNEA